ncbi:MAG: DUF4265 domain-containing protein [Betaproteobacteria bacterium]|nr:DUF4265 domain-containing protein [Betaproteobacteria bacterium]
MAHVKVAFEVPNEDGSLEVETLRAEPIANDLYRLDNSPFYAFSVSWRDEVLALPSSDGLPTYQKVVRKSGHRTVRVWLDPPFEEGNESAREMQDLVELGCSFEGAYSRLMSINIPPNIDLTLIRKHLIDRGLEWEHADPTYEELFPNASTDA